MATARLLFCLASMMWACLAVSVSAADDAAASAAVRKESLGGLRLEQSPSQVLKLLGKPEKKGKLELQEASGRYFQSWNYPSRGLKIVMSIAIDEKGSQYVALITATAPCDLATQRGIKIGSPATATKRAYATWVDRDTPATHDAFVVGSIYDGIIFNFEHDKVSRIFFGAAAE